MNEDKTARPIGDPANHTIKYWRGRDGRFHDTAGENSRTSKLTEDIVRTIKFERPNVTSVDVAKEFGMSANYVRQIRQGRKWGHVKE